MATTTYTYIGAVTASGSVAILSFTGISTSYTQLRVIGYAREGQGGGTGPYQEVRWRANNYAVGGYYTLAIYEGNTNAQSSQVVTDGIGGQCGYIPGSAATPSGLYGSFVADFIGSNKRWISLWQSFSGNSGNSINTFGGSYCKYPTTDTAITTLSIYTDSGNNFAAGSTFKLFGLL